MKSFFTFPNILFLLSVLLILTDVYRSGDRLETYIGIDSRTVALMAVIIFGTFRLFQTKLTQIHKRLSHINSYILLPITLVSSLSLSVWGFLTPPNFVYSLTHLQYQQLFILGIFSLVVALIQQPDAWFKKYAYLIIFLSSIGIFAAAEVVWMFPFEAFRILSREDGFIEYLQVLALLLALFWSLKIARAYFNKKLFIQTMGFGLAALLLFFVAGDEISWGQRIFGLETPTMISEQNYQGEITIHNLKSVNSFVDTGFMVMGAFGAFAWIIQRVLSFLKKPPFSYLIPPWFVSFYFFLDFVYFVWARYFPNYLIGHWSEYAELMFYIGIMFTIYYRKQAQ